ncbi:F-box domain-containing protein [Mycena sanguinolenta]|uniref:F-box domain-containing protein n=1 Tax=Mycena sanguinolenta TaxID=230812 RepID=A0A8H6ZHC4_9AGAR|nr:F-box domain-containing protein [Mycena sanguinolenta]
MSTTSSRAADRARIAEIDDKILALKHSIQVLEAEKMRTQERLDEYTYPVLSLPNEIVSEIFNHFVPIYPSPPPLVGYLSPTVLTHICRTWREIAFTTPALWRARSRGLPLSFWMQPAGQTLSDECLAALIFHRARWEYMTLMLASESDAAGVQGAMPLLLQLDILSWGNTRPRIRFDEAPRLRSVIFWSNHSSTETFPWSQLTSLTLLYDADCPAILQHAVNLIYFHLVLWGESETAVTADIRLPCLKTLVLTQFEEGDDHVATHYLEALIAPSLRTLEVAEALLQPNPVGALHSFISKSGCHLQELCITGDTRSVSEVVYRHRFKDVPKFSFDMAVTDYYSYAEKFSEKRYVVL